MVKFVKVISSGAGTLTALGDDGETYVLNGTAGWRANNPGNLRPGSLTNDLGAIGVMDTGSNGKFLVFPDRQTGEQARSSLLFDSPAYANKTLLKAIEKYAPTGDNNDPAAYANRLAAAAGVDVNTKVSDLTPAQRRAITAAQPGVENNTPGTIKAASGSVRPEVAQQFSANPLPPSGLPLDAGLAMTGPAKSYTPLPFSGPLIPAKTRMDAANAGSRNSGALANTTTLGWNDGTHTIEGETIRGTLKPADYATARLTADNVGGVGSVSDPNLSSLTSPLQRAMARLAAAGGTGKAGTGVSGSANLTAAAAPTPMPSRPADVVQAAAQPAPVQTIRVGKHDYQVGQTFDQGGMHYVVTPHGIESSRIQTGEKTVMSGIVGSVIKSAVPEVQAGISTAAGKVGQNFAEMGTNLTTSASKVGASLGANASQIGNSLGATFGGLGSMFGSKPATTAKLTASGTANTSAKANALSYVAPKVKPAAPVGSAFTGGFGSSALRSTPSLSASGSVSAGNTNALAAGALARAPMLVAGGAANPTPKRSVSAVPTMTLAQYNQRQQALTQQIAAKAVPAVVHSNALQAPVPVYQPPQQTQQQAQQDLRDSGMLDSSGMVTGSGGHSMWGSH